MELENIMKITEDSMCRSEIHAMSGREGQTLPEITSVWNLNKRAKLTADWGLPQGWGWGIGEEGQQVQNANYKISHEDVIYSMVIIVNDTVSPI